MKIEVDLDGLDKASDEFKAARREINRRLKAGLLAAGEKVALPEAKRRAPRKTGRLVGSLVVRASARNATLGTNLRGKKGRYVGLLEWGGTVRTPIKPNGKALKVGSGFASEITTPRTYRGQHFLSGAIKAKQNRIQETVRDEVIKAFADFDTT